MQIKAAPVAPGATTAAIQDLNEGQATLTFDNLGNPRLQAIKKGVDSTIIPISITADIVAALLTSLKLVDTVLTKCTTNPALNPIPTELTQIEVAQSNTNPNAVNYKDYIIEIVEIPYSSTVSRKKSSCL